MRQEQPTADFGTQILPNMFVRERSPSCEGGGACRRTQQKHTGNQRLPKETAGVWHLSSAAYPRQRLAFFQQPQDF